MGNIITYVQEKGHLAFDELGFNEVDSLILSELSYLSYEGWVNHPVAFDMTIGKLRAAGFPASRPSNDYSPDRCEQLFQALAGSRRFRDVGVDFFDSEIDPREEKQFAAVTFRLSPRLHYIAYRGTDNTFVGWKEDLNMSFLEDIPAQKSAVAYLERMAERMRSTWILGGHSKGGNLAVYAGMSAPPKLQRDVALIYDHDGPGFLDRVLQRPGFQAIQDRIYKTVPESAVVGLLLAEHEQYTIVESDAKAIMQHDPFSWQVENGEFVRAQDTDLLSKTTDRTLNHWLSTMDDGARRTFVDALYGLIQATGATTLPELTENWRGNIPSVYFAIRQMDPEIRKALFETVGGLVRASGESVWEMLDERLAQTREDVRNDFIERFQRWKDARE